jgi:hypothetical protein
MHFADVPSKGPALRLHNNFWVPLKQSEISLSCTACVLQSSMRTYRATDLGYDEEAREHRRTPRPSTNWSLWTMTAGTILIGLGLIALSRSVWRSSAQLTLEQQQRSLKQPNIVYILADDLG